MKSVPPAFVAALLLLGGAGEGAGAYVAPPSAASSSPLFSSSRSRARFASAAAATESSTSSSSTALHGSSQSADAPPLRRHRPRRIALMVEPTPFTHVSGYSNRFKEMLRYLSKAGDQVEILTTDNKTPVDDLPRDAFGYEIHHTQGFTFPLYNHITLTVDLPEIKGAKIIERLKPDLIHVTSPGFLIYAAMFYARVMRIPLVMSYHTHLPSYGKNYLGFIPGIEEFAWFLLRFAHTRCDLTLVTSPQMRDELVANGIPRVDVWRKGIDTVRFDPKFKSTAWREKMSGGHPDDFLMVYVGRLGAEKRLKDIKPVLERVPNARLCIVGGGPYEDELRAHFEGTKTVFTGQLSGDDLSRAFASADAFMMPSDSETLGFVVLESMASGVPVIGADAGGIPDIIDDEDTGFLVEPGDTKAFVDRVKKLQDPQFREAMGRRARKEAERWGWEAATSQLRNVQYEKAMINYHTRAFGGFGRPKSAGMWRLLGYRIKRLLGRLRVPGFRRNGKALEL